MKNIFCIIFILSTTVLLHGQSFWKKTEESRIQLRSSQNRSIIPDAYDTYTLNIDAMRTYLTDAPMEQDAGRKQKELILDIPMTDGTLEKFKVYESPVMQEKISARYPSIKSYKAYSVTNKSRNMRFTLAPNGYHASINTLEGEAYIDPYSSENKTEYIVYNVADDHSADYKGVEICGVEDTERPNISYFRPSQRNAPAVELRVYKLAMACSGEWGIKRGTVALALADMNTMVARMNSMYEKDMAMRFVLIDDNDKLIFLDPATDPYTTPESGRTTLGNNTNILNQRVASTLYDIGHVLL
ncbi:MAG: reprolysin-like metallopeptidase, partial [Saprospiraceae bacterium]